MRNHDRIISQIFINSIVTSFFNGLIKQKKKNIQFVFDFHKFIRNELLAHLIYTKELRQI